MARIASSLLLAVLLSVPVSAQQMISGVVTDTAGRPVAGARVAFAGVDTVLVTAADGAYAYCCLPDHVRSVRVTAPGYGGVVARIPEFSGLCASIRLAPTDDAARGAALMGDIFDADGRPVALATARVVGMPLGGFSTEPFGVFSIPDVPPGPCFIDVEASGFVPAHVRVLADSVSVQWLPPVRLASRSAGRVSGLDHAIRPQPSLPDPMVRTVSGDALIHSSRISILDPGDR